jgi:diadenosine tetraphosphatase ApaH/serine/threonine PP2A family protein phosphatase
VAVFWLEFQISNRRGWDDSHLLRLRGELDDWINGEILPRLTDHDPLLPDNLKMQIRVLFLDSVGVGYDHHSEPDPWGDLPNLP